MPIELLVEDGTIEATFSRNMHRPWSEEFSGDPICVGATFHYDMTQELRAIEPLAISGIGGPVDDPSGPLYRPGAMRPSVAPGRLAEAVGEHPDFARVLASQRPRSGSIFVDDPAEDGDY